MLLSLLAHSAFAQQPLLQLDLITASGSPPDPTYVYAQAGATTGFDAAYDADKFFNSNGLNLSTITPDNRPLAINALPPEAFKSTLAVALFVGVPQDGDYTLRVSQLNNFEFSQIYLIDNQTNTRQLLAVGTTYSFGLMASDPNGAYGTSTRFSLDFEPASVPLPITLASFTAQPHGPDALLRWVTASELNNAYFVVESSSDGTSFRRLGQVAGAGTSSQAHTYQFTDAGLARYAGPQVYYRLRQVDAAGTGTYSPVRSVAVPLAAFAVEAFPTYLPPGQALGLRICAPALGPATLRITDVLGRQVGQQVLDLQAGAGTVTLPGAGQWPAGLYLLQVRQGPQQQTVRVVRE